MPDRLIADQRLAKHLALLRPIERIFETDAGIGCGLLRHPQSLAVEIAHDAHEAAIFRPDQVFGRHLNIVEMQRGCVGGVPAHFRKRGAAKARPVGFDKKQ